MPNTAKSELESGREVLRGEGITFNLFKSVVAVLLVNPKFNEDFWVWLYECYAEGRASYKETIEEWADEHFCEFTIQNNNTELRKRKWVESKYRKPPENEAVLVFLDEEDNHVTTGMWDVSGKWVLLDEYRTPECEVTHWMKLPDLPTAS